MVRSLSETEPATASAAVERAWLSSERAIYFLACSAVLVLMAGHTTNHLWSGLDFWVWLGPVREFSEHLFDPSHPLVATQAGDLYMGPYSLFLGLVARATGLEAFTVLAWAGMVNLLLLLAGIRYFSRRLSRQLWTPHFLLVFTLLAWGWMPWRWSGYPNLNSLGTVLPLGSTAAYALSLFVLGLWWTWLKSGRRTHLVLTVLLFVVVLLTHQMTALWTGLIGVGFLVSKARVLKPDRWRDLVVAGAGGLALVWIWPYYSLLSALKELGGFDIINAATYRYVLRRSVLALPGVVIVVWSVRKKKDVHLSIAFALMSSVFVFGWLTDKGSLGRVLPGLMLIAHLAMADWAAGRMRTDSHTHRERRWVALGVCGLLAIGLLGTAPGWLRSVPRGFVPETIEAKLRLTSYVDPNRGFAAVIGSQDVVVADSRVAIPIGGNAAKVTSVGIPQPFIPDAPQRREDAEAILDPATPPGRRSQLLSVYEPDWLVVRSAVAGELLAQVPGATLTATVNGYAVIRLKP
jgi:hypothetical protein